MKVYIDNLSDIIYKLSLSKDIILLGIEQAYKTLQHGPLGEQDSINVINFLWWHLSIFFTLRSSVFIARREHSSGNATV